MNTHRLPCGVALWTRRAHAILRCALMLFDRHVVCLGLRGPSAPRILSHANMHMRAGATCLRLHKPNVNAFLGIHMRSLNTESPVIEAVDAGSIADVQGCRVGMRVLRCNGVPCEGAWHAAQLLERTPLTVDLDLLIPDSGDRDRSFHPC